MPLPDQPDIADLAADALMKAKRLAPGGLLRPDIARVLRPLIVAHVAQEVSKARYEPESSPLCHTGTKGSLAKLFTAVCQGCGLAEDGMTRPMKKSVATARAIIVQVMPNVTPEEILLRAKQYRRKHPTWELTPMSLAKHWGGLATEESLQGRLDEPAGWREKVGQIFPESDCGATGEYLAKETWPKIARPHQERICRVMEQINKHAKAHAN